VNYTGDGGTIVQLSFHNPPKSETEAEALAALIEQTRETKEASPFGIPGTTLHNLPHSQNPFFTGRKKLLEELGRMLSSSGSSTALSQPAAIAGLGGIGKTQIAIEYAYKHMNDYKAVLWVNSETRNTITASYAQIARILVLPQRNEKELEVIVGGRVAHHSWWAGTRGFTGCNVRLQAT